MYVVLNEEVPIQANCIEVHFLKTWSSGLVSMINPLCPVAGVLSLRLTQRNLRRWVRAQLSWLLTPNHQQAVCASQARWQSRHRNWTGCHQSSPRWRLVSVAAELTLPLPLPHPHCFPTNSHLCCCSPIHNLPLLTFTLTSQCRRATRRVTVRDATIRQRQNWSASWKTQTVLLLFFRYRTPGPDRSLATKQAIFSFSNLLDCFWWFWTLGLVTLCWCFQANFRLVQTWTVTVRFHTWFWAELWQVKGEELWKFQPYYSREASCLTVAGRWSQTWDTLNSTYSVSACDLHTFQIYNWVERCTPME